MTFRKVLLTSECVSTPDQPGCIPCRMQRRGLVPRAAGLPLAIAILLGTLPLQGCHDLFGLGACTLEVEYGVKVEVRDSVTGDLLGAEANGTLTEGSYRETMERWSDQTLAGAPERAGAYRVEITVDGYNPWILQPVIVTRGRCHVGTVHLQANMVPLAA